MSGLIINPNSKLIIYVYRCRYIYISNIAFSMLPHHKNRNNKLKLKKTLFINKLEGKYKIL